MEVDSPRFRADGQHFAYKAVSQKAESACGLFIRWKMVVDGKEGPEFEESSLAVFSPDGQHLKNQEVILLDGKETSEFDAATQF